MTMFCYDSSLLKNRRGFCTLVLIIFSVIIYTMYYYDGNPCISARCMAPAIGEQVDNDVKLGHNFVGFNHYADGKHRLGIGRSRSQLMFDYNGADVMVFLHIQKTGGSFMEKALTRHLKEVRCDCVTKRSCECFRPRGKEAWIVCRFTNGGWPCGLHADWNELQVCVPELLNHYYGKNSKRRFFLSTILREPVTRYLSEFRHVQRGATWKKARHMCGGRTPSVGEIKFCYNGSTWEVESLEAFANCPHNMANNRQTRMLANLSLVGCYNESFMSAEKRNILMLKSAKENLQRMAYFALLEQQTYSQFIFEKTFGLTFKVPFQQYDTGYAQEYYNKLSEADLELIKRKNHLDIQLYEFARKLFETRMKILSRKFGPPVRNVTAKSNRNFTASDRHMFKKNLRKNNRTKEWKTKKKTRRRRGRKYYNDKGVAILL